MKENKAIDIAKELNISRSYLYKIIDKEQIKLPRAKSGRYFWNEESIEKVKNILDDEPEKMDKIQTLISELGLKQSFINNRRYLGNKYSLSDFIRRTVEENCSNVKVVADVFSGTGAVSNAFKDKQIITNDLLYSNYISNYAWFYPQDYNQEMIVSLIYEYNQVETSESNYMRDNFDNTFFSADDCSKIGYIRENIEQKFIEKKINFKEYSILITSLLYAMDKIANTVGHYDAYRKNVEFDKELILNVLLPEKNLNNDNKCFNENANDLIKNIECDLLYLDPPYNSRQYSDAYHLLENVARWQKPEVFGVARKMDRSSLKSDYCMIGATDALEKLVKDSYARYILLSYNNMSEKGVGRSNAKISDEDILRILGNKGKVTVFEEGYKTFSTGKSNIKDNKERLFLCEVNNFNSEKIDIASPFNYTGGKFKLLKQMQPLFVESPVSLDLFSGGGNVGLNSNSKKVIMNDINEKIIDLMEYFKATPTNQILSKVDEVILRYGLSNTALYGYEYYNCDSSKGLAKYNKEKFLRLREDYNRSIKEGNEDIVLLYVLIIFSFNNQIRFNSKGEYNLPVGKRDFNPKMRRKLILFSEELKRKEVIFSKKDFRNISLDELPKNTFIYCDPPYLITDATYNENGLWTEKDENDLYEFLDRVNDNGFKFALSNVIASKGNENKILSNWVSERRYECNFLDRSYSNSNYQRKDRDKASVEVLITNYKAKED